MERTPAYLAALSSVAVPGLDPVTVEALPSLPEHEFDIAFIQDSEHRRWVLRAPRSESASARLHATTKLLGMLGRRLPFGVPQPKGTVALSGCGRAVVYPYLPGRSIDMARLRPGPGVAADLGRALAALHNLDAAIFDEAGMPTYDADAYRTRRLAEVDQGAGTGRIPTTLLGRWETALEDVSLWRFAATPIHGDLTGDHVLAVFDDDSDTTTGRVRSVTGWEDAKVADPADDFADLLLEAETEALETVLEAYSHARVDRPDPNLMVRARLSSELAQLSALLGAVTSGNEPAAEVLTTQLRRLDDEVHTASSTDDYRRMSLAPVPVRTRPVPPPAPVEEDDEDDDVVAVSDPSAADEDPGTVTDPVGRPGRH